MKIYSPNPGINAKLLKLLKLGAPPLPVAPRVDPKHPDGHHIQRVVKHYKSNKPEFVGCDGGRVEVGGDYCSYATTRAGDDLAPVRGDFVRLDEKFNPVGRFTGKNPSYLDIDGKPHILLHGPYQKRMPTEQELIKWFANPNTGIGTLGGHNGIVWIDFDAKNYPTQEDCDRDVEALLARIGQPTLTEKTGSGGWRVAVRPKIKPTFTNFSTSPGGNHLGEALFEGRFTVLAPSRHPNGNYYREISNDDPAEIESLEAVGIFPSSDEVANQIRSEKREKRSPKNANSGTHNYSDPTGDPWDIRNFALFLEGYTERNGWGYAKCPAHNGSSLTSFRVNLSGGGFLGRCGCDTKAIYEAAKRHAESCGHKIPEYDRTFSHNAQIEHGREISRDEWALNLDKVEGLGGWRNFAGALQKELNRKRPSPWGFSKKSESPPKPEPKYAPEIVQEYAPGHRLEFWSNAAKNHQYILDTSGTGTGKSHDSGLCTPELFEVGRIIYISNDHRNPTTKTLEEWDDLEARHSGLIRDDNGKIRRRENWKDTREFIADSNCGRIQTINALRSKNISGADTSELICQTCPHRDGCRGGAIYGYLNQRASILGDSTRFRAHPQSLPPADSDFYNPDAEAERGASTCIFWEEGGPTFAFKQVLEAKHRDVSDVIATFVEGQSIENKDFSVLLSLLGKVRSLLSGEAKLPFYGFNHHELLEILGEFPSDIDIHEVERFLNEDGVVKKILDPYEAEYGVSLGDLPRGVKKNLTESDSELASKIESTLKQKWLVALLKIWKGEQLGYLSLMMGSLSISILDSKCRDVASAAKANIVLDANLTREQLSLMLGCDPDDILVCRQAECKVENLEIIQITELGRLGKQRGKKQAEGLAAVVTELRKQEPNTKVIDFKESCKPGDGAWWRDNRGSNDFLESKALILCGSPVANLAAQYADFTLLYGRLPQSGKEKITRHITVIAGSQIPNGSEPTFISDESSDSEFREFARANTLATIHQGFGRLRANLRPQEKLKVYFVADFALDCPVTLVNAVDVAPQAATTKQLFLMELEKARAAGYKSLNDVAAYLRKAKSTISENIRRWFGVSWEEFISKLCCSVLLDKPFDSRSEQPTSVSEKEQEEAEQFCADLLEIPTGEELLPEIALIIKSMGWRSWGRIIGLMSAPAKSALIEQLAALVPKEIWEFAIAAVVPTGWLSVQST